MAECRLERLDDSGPTVWFREEIIFADSSTDTSDLWGVPISNRTWKIAGKPRQLTSGTGKNIDGRVSTDGQVVFASLTRNFNFWGLPLDANVGGSRRIGAPHPGRGFPLGTEPFTGWQDAGLCSHEPHQGRSHPEGPRHWQGKLHFRCAPTRRLSGIQRGRHEDRFFERRYGREALIYVFPVAGGIPEMVCEDCGLGPSVSSDGTRILYDWGIPRYIGLLEIATRQTTQLLRDPKYGLLQGRFSPDGRWICFQRAVPSSGNNRLMVAPFRGTAEIPSPMDSGHGWLILGQTTLAGPQTETWIYFNSIRDGFQCLWAQRLDPVTKRPAGETFSVYHFHSASRPHGRDHSLGPMTISVIRDRIAMSLQESTGNIWTFKLPETK